MKSGNSIVVNGSIGRKSDRFCADFTNRNTRTYVAVRKCYVIVSYGSYGGF